jgi:ParB-like chromosome segregation protein Spo0J
MSETEKLKIVYLKIGDIKPYERNNKKHPKEQIDKLVKIIQAGKFDVPIVVDANHVIIKGHARLKACKQLKMREVPCIIRTDTSEIQNRTDRIADNKSGELAETDLENLKLEMADLQLEGIDVELTGFSDWILEPEFTPDLPDENKDNVSPEEKLVLIVTLENQGDKQQLFDELRDRGYKVKV